MARATIKIRGVGNSLHGVHIATQMNLYSTQTVKQLIGDYDFNYDTITDAKLDIAKSFRALKKNKHESVSLSKEKDNSEMSFGNATASIYVPGQ